MAVSSLREVKAEPNLVPILDMVFQLITFFLLVTNFKAAEIDFNLKLPVVGSARPVSTEGHVGVVVLNIDKRGNVRTTGPITDIDRYMRSEAVARMLSARMTAADLEAGKEIPTTVVIRADRAASFRMVNRVIKACQDNGFRSFALKARSEEG
jgi:biopolymer transport protein ExbD